MKEPSKNYTDRIVLENDERGLSFYNSSDYSPLVYSEENKTLTLIHDAIIRNNLIKGQNYKISLYARGYKKYLHPELLTLKCGVEKLPDNILVEEMDDGTLKISCDSHSYLENIDVIHFWGIDSGYDAHVSIDYAQKHIDEGYILLDNRYFAIGSGKTQIFIDSNIYDDYI